MSMNIKEMFSLLSMSEQKFKKLLAQVGYKCNADGRAYIAARVKVNDQRPLPKNAKQLLEKATEIGGLKPGESFRYPTYNGDNIARVCDLYDLPEEMENPFMVCFSGHMGAPFFCMEALRFYAKKTGTLLPFLAIGKGGNKGLFESVFDREKGIIQGTEYEAYLNIMEAMAPKEYVRKYQTVFEDMDTAGNLRELYRFAKEKGLKEVTYVLVTGQPWYDKRVLAEWMLALCDIEDIKINLVLVHCPLWLDGALPETRVSEISLGYAAASIGPLMKDTITFEGDTSSENPERYSMPGVKEADWEGVEELIKWFGNMGWPNYEELLYDTPHELAVEHIILADLFARASFTPESYDEAAKKDIEAYKKFVGISYMPNNEKTFHIWCMNSTDKKFFE